MKVLFCHSLRPAVLNFGYARARQLRTEIFFQQIINDAFLFCRKGVIQPIYKRLRRFRFYAKWYAKGTGLRKTGLENKMSAMRYSKHGFDWKEAKLVKLVKSQVISSFSIYFKFWEIDFILERQKLTRPGFLKSILTTFSYSRNVEPTFLKEKKVLDLFGHRRSLFINPGVLLFVCHYSCKVWEIFQNVILSIRWNEIRTHNLKKVRICSTNS